MEEKRSSSIKVNWSGKLDGINIAVQEYGPEDPEKRHPRLRISGTPESDVLSLAKAIQRAGADVEIVILES